MITINTISELKSLVNPSNITDVLVKGYYAINDGGGGFFYWDAGSTEAQNNGTIIQSEFTTNGRWKRIYNEHLNILWFGGKPNSSSVADQTLTRNAIQNAINLLHNAGLYGEIIIPSGTYYLNGNITTYVDIKLKGVGNPTLYRSGTFSSSTYFITINTTGNSVGWTYSKTALEGLIISGKLLYSDQPAIYTSDLTALRIYASQFQILNCSFFGFDKTTEFESNSFIINFIGCGFRQNNYGIYFNATNKTNLGENIRFIDSVIAGNNVGVYNILGGLYFNNCSFDYNLMHIGENISKISGTLSLNIVIDNSHIENSISRSGKGTRMLNNGVLIINNSIITDDILTANSLSNEIISYVTNNSYLILTNNCFRMNEGKYFAKGLGLVSEANSIPISNDQIARISINNSGLRNGSFDRGSFSNSVVEGWTINEGSNANITSSNLYDSAFALKLSPTSQYIGTYVISDYITIPVDRLGYIVTGWRTQSNHSGYCIVYLYDKNKTQIDSNLVALGTGAVAKFKLQKSFVDKSEFLRIEFRCEFGNTGNAIYIDDIYLSFLLS